MTQRKSKKIATLKEYNATMKKVDALMKIGEANLTDSQVDEIRERSLAAQAFEQGRYLIPAPSTLEGIIELAMYEQKLKQKELAKKLGIGEAKLSQILSRKRKPDVVFLKAAHQVLGIDGNQLLELA
ncbi:helix-turn-helix domain-containing protein [Pseudocnuella soli]|uniref:helix-turn-helix domain-containing protein n=1 Tax=Pseudocnuella soli TaxID=2502779 RepID=UPI00105149E5|nr:helix-turn-helix transcriptional regulator [Pseudocnuella soli]